MCQPPTVAFTPATGSTYSGATTTYPLQVTVKWCANSALQSSSRQIRFNGTIVTSQFTYTSSSACSVGVGATSVGTVQLLPGSNTLTANITNADGLDGAGTAQYTFDQQAGPPFSVAVTPDGDRVSTADSLPSAALFAVKNTSAQAATFTLSAVCTGSAVTNCAPTQTAVTLSGGGSAPVGVTFRAGAVGAKSTVMLKAWKSDASAVRDSGTVTLGVSAEPATGSVNDPDQQPAIVRGLCLTASVGEGAAYECGDLRLTHTLPATRVLNRTRAPTLIYNSQFGRPIPTVGMTVSPPAGTTPDSVIASLTVNAGTGGATVARGAWVGWIGGEARRITLAFDAASYATGVYDVTLTVETKKSGTVAALTSRNGRIIIVNRGSSPFGRGWWLAGLEQIIPRGDGSLLWIGGDGSAKLYIATGQSGRWAATALTRPDTLRADTAQANLGGWVRELPGGARVVFDAQGHHVRTVNALGHRSEFVWNGERLTKILLPQGDSFTTGYEYLFEYTAGNRLLRVTAPHATVSGDRVTRFAVDGVGHITTITDPDTSVVTFVPDAAVSGVIRRRTDRMGVPADFTFDGYRRLAKVEIDRDSTPGIATTFVAQESLGRPGAAAVLSANVLTTIDGPRAGADITRIRLDRFGAPVQITNALGQITNVVRTNRFFPALVTYVRGPTGAEQSAVFDAGGRLIASTSWSGSAGVATSLYEWDATWDAVTRVTSPTGVTSLTAYDPATGQRLWQQAGQDSARRVHYTYRPRTDTRAPGLVATVQSAAAATRGEAPLRIEYDVRGNLERTISPLGIHDSTFSDRIGRDTAAASTGGPRTTTVYDLAGRARTSVTRAGGASTLQRLTVAQTYDRSGRVLTTTRTMDPDSNLIGVMTITNVYDRVGRLIQVFDPANVVETFAYDSAGNRTAHVSRRGLRSTTEYDLLNRPTRHITPEISHASLYPVTHWGRTWTFPRHSLDPELAATDSTRIRGDTATFTYNALGGILTANNRDARITRTYNIDGSLATERQQVRTYTGADYTSHNYLIQYGYDLEGRRRLVRYPSQLASIGQDSAIYRYDALGQLSEVVDPMGSVFRYAYDDEGRLERIDQPGRVSENFRYDADGRQDSLWVRADTLVGTSGGYLTPDVFNNGLQYDARGKLREVRGDHGGSGDYDGMGALKQWVALNESNSIRTTTIFDPLGNPAGETARGWDESGGIGNGIDTYTRFEYSSRTGRQMARMVAVQGTDQIQTMERQWYDAAGNRTEWGHQSVVGTQRTMFEHSRAYYGADDRLRVVDRQRCMTQVLPTGAACGVWDYSVNPEKGAFEEYRYDALGRRVLVRRRFAIVNGTAMTETCTGCWHSIDRVVWDGDQILGEIRAPGITRMESDLPTGEAYGRVAYTHAIGIDQPISIIRLGYANPSTLVMIPHANYRGVLTTAHFPTGKPTQGAVDLRQLPWAGANNTATMAKAYPSQPLAWIGSLPSNLADASGQLYRRNRYYDPASGRFTQEDPIGLAGGLNLYAFGGGDPVSFTDPSGLTVEFSGQHSVVLARNYRKMRLAAEIAENAGPRPIAAAGRLLGQMMDDLEISSVPTRIGTAEVLTTPGALAETASRWDGDEAERVRITMKVGWDYSYVGQNQTHQLLVLSHELGHAWAAVMIGKRSEGFLYGYFANAAENAARRIIGCYPTTPGHNIRSRPGDSCL